MRKTVARPSAYIRVPIALQVTRTDHRIVVPMMSTPRRSTLLVLLGLLALHPVAGQEPAPAGGSINAADLRRDVFFLASDDMRGRLVGTPENRRAAEFIERRFAELGLRGIAADASYLQSFGLLTATLGETSVFTVRSGNDRSEGALGSDFYPERFSGTGQAEGPVVFVGFGIVAPGVDHDDYQGADIQGRVVLALDHEPGEFDPKSPFDGVASSEHRRSVRKALAAQRRGAVAILFVADVHNHSTRPELDASMRRTWPSDPGRVPAYQLADWVEPLRIPALRISVQQAEHLAAGTGETLEALAQRAEHAGGVAPIALPGVMVEVEASVQRQTLPVHNVVGLIEGADPVLRDEWIILCAHYDHEGANGTQVFTGADDDASGVAGILEIAEAYAFGARVGRRPRRSILFAAWNAEERGLLGAWAYTQQPLAPLENTVAVINMDMIGRNEEVPTGGGRRFNGLEPQTAESNRNAVNILGYSYSSDLRKATEIANDAAGLDLRFRYDNNRSNLLRRSDHWPFLFHSVPAIFVHTGLHPDYHTERDRPETLDYDKMSRVVRLVFQLSWNLAQEDSRPALD